MEIRELQCEFETSQKSFYGKAKVLFENGSKFLISYDTRMIENNGVELIFKEDSNLYSNTTLRHVREYLRQIGKIELANLAKAKLLKTLEKSNYRIGVDTNESN